MPVVLSTKQVGQLINRPDWQVRVVVDGLTQPVPRIGRQRAIPSDRVAEIAQAIEERYGKHRSMSEAAAV